jgi:hypothetical protein
VVPLGSCDNQQVLVACAVLGLDFSAGLTVAGNCRGAFAVIGQVGAELPPGGVRTCSTASVLAGAYLFVGLHWTASEALLWVRALDAQARASGCQADQKRYR